MILPPSVPDPERPVRVLLVDDDEEDYILTRDVVAEIPGHRYTLAWESDFEAGIDSICRGDYDVYLVDYRLGTRTGLDLLDAIKERGCLGPVILLTGQSHPEIDRAAEEAGAADYLEKGRLDPVLLERTIRYAIRQRAQELELELKVAERTAELTAANSALAEADRRKDEYLATLAHELRNPLAPIRNALEIMRLTMRNPAAIGKAREMVERQIATLVRLIDDLLDVSRFTRDHLKLHLEVIDLAEPMRLAIETAQPPMDRSGVVFTPVLPVERIAVNGDSVRLAQLFTNLLSNAAKYTMPGGKVSLTLEKIASQAIIRVTDTGAGIPPEFLPKVFDLFTQVDRKLNRPQSGLGIGLAFAKRLAELHGGTVTAKSEGLGRGAEFTVALPLAEGCDDSNCRCSNPIHFRNRNSDLVDVSRPIG